MRRFLFLVACLSLSTAQQIPQAQYKQGCELLGKKIYCFGGAVRDLTANNPGYSDSFTNNHYVLDLTNFTTSQDAANLKWEVVPPPSNGFSLEARADFAHVKVSDNSYLVFGGAGSEKTYAANPNLRNLTTIYFADQNSWQTIPTSQFPANTILTAQGFGAQATMDANGTVWLLGGVPPSPQANSFNINTTLFKLDAQNPQWTSFTATPLTPTTDSTTRYNPTFHQGVVAMRNGYIYSYGGLTMTFPYNNYKNSYDSSDSFFKLPGVNTYMYEFLAYNKSGNNTNYYNYGYIYPNPRELHTMTILPNTDTYLMYGGVSGFNVLNDYCYTFDTKIRQWSKVLFQGGGPGPRFGHSAVSYGNDSLFVMFGVNSNGNVMNDAYVLNTTTFTWTAIPSTNGTTGSDSSPTGSSGIGTGAIVGIVIGALAVIAIIAGGGFFLYRRGTFNSGEPATTFTAPVYGQDGFDDEFARPTDEKFVGARGGGGGGGGHVPLETFGAANKQEQPSTPGSIKVKPMAYEGSDYGGGLPMKPMSEMDSSNRMSSPSTCVDDPTKPYSERLSDEARSTSNLVKPSNPYSDNRVVKPHGFE